MIDPITLGLIGGGILGGLGGFSSGRSARRRRRRLRRALQDAQRRSNEIVGRLTGEDSTFARARNFLNNTFDEGGNSAVAANVGRGVRAAQAGRGLFQGNASIIQEGSARGVAATQFQAALAPLAQTFEFAPEQLRAQLTQQFFQNRGQVDTTGLTSQFESTVGGVLSGAGLGGQAAASISQLFNLDNPQAQSGQVAAQGGGGGGGGGAAGAVPTSILDQFLNPAGQFNPV